MKKYLLIILTVLILVSCGNNSEQSVSEETGEIITDYVDTLEGSISDAKEVQNLIDNKNNDLLEEIKK